MTQRTSAAAAAETKDSVTLTDNSTGQSWDLPIIGGTAGPRVIDVRKLYADTGFFTHDPGFTSTSSCESDITFIDGEKGLLLHRGYRIEDLAEHSDFTPCTGRCARSPARECSLRSPPRTFGVTSLVATLRTGAQRPPRLRSTPGMDGGLIWPPIPSGTRCSTMSWVIRRHCPLRKIDGHRHVCLFYRPGADRGRVRRPIRVRRAAPHRDQMTSSPTSVIVAAPAGN